MQNDRPDFQTGTSGQAWASQMCKTGKRPGRRPEARYTFSSDGVGLGLKYRPDGWAGTGHVFEWLVGWLYSELIADQNLCLMSCDLLQQNVLSVKGFSHRLQESVLIVLLVYHLELTFSVRAMFSSIVRIM
jgi:hypothetical protein